MQNPIPARPQRRMPAVLVLVAFGLIQDPLIVNWQLWTKAPNLFPALDFTDIAALLGDALFILLAGFFLIVKSSQMRSLAWWVGFAAMALPYVYLKNIGVYYDHTQYLIAASEGRRVGGGAAMGHLPLVLYAMGPAAVLTSIGFGATRWLQKLTQRP